MAERARSSAQSTKQKDEAETRAETKAETKNGDGGALTKDVHPSEPAEGRAEGGRSATLNLPFVTAQFRAPDLHVPSRDELGAAAQSARSMLPSRSAMLFYGGLAVTAVVGAIEWPVAAAIGVGSALASRGAANPQPGGGTPQPAGTGGQTGDGNKNGDK